MKSERVVACAIDDNYAWPFLVSMYSMKRNASQTFRLVLGYEPSRLSKENRVLIQKVSDIYEITLEFLALDLEGIQEQNMHHVTATSYARLLIFDKFPQSVLWIDADTICLQGWDKIFELAGQFESGIAAMVVQDSVVFRDPLIKDLSNQARQLSGKNYFNSGIMFVQTEKWRELNMPRLWRMAYANYSTLGFQYEDQCILNYVLLGKCKLISKSYNFIVNRDSRSHSDMRVIHFAGEFKPWHLSGLYAPFFWFRGGGNFIRIYNKHARSFLMEIFFCNYFLFFSILRLQRNVKKNDFLLESILQRIRSVFVFSN